MYTHRVIAYHTMKIKQPSHVIFRKLITASNTVNKTDQHLIVSSVILKPQFTHVSTHTYRHIQGCSHCKSSLLYILNTVHSHIILSIPDYSGYL